MFPWVLRDYTSASLDLSDPAIYRDLTKPVGALNEDRLAVFQVRMRVCLSASTCVFFACAGCMRRVSGPLRQLRRRRHPALFLWQSLQLCRRGAESFFCCCWHSHANNPNQVLHYLMRLEPFTSAAVKLQDGHFDHADRLFTDIPTAWKLCNSNLSDVKELVPEFFYLPDFLRNVNKVNFGQTQKGVAVRPTASGRISRNIACIRWATWGCRPGLSRPRTLCASTARRWRATT